MKEKESDIQRTIKDYLQWMGWYVWKNHQSALSHKGVSDLTAIKNGIVLWIEIKTENGKQSKNQKLFEREIKEHAGHYFIARKWEDVSEYIAAL